MNSQNYKISTIMSDDNGSSLYVKDIDSGVCVRVIELQESLQYKVSILCCLFLWDDGLYKFIEYKHVEDVLKDYKGINIFYKEKIDIKEYL